MRREFRGGNGGAFVGGGARGKIAPPTPSLCVERCSLKSTAVDVDESLISCPSTRLFRGSFRVVVPLPFQRRDQPQTGVKVTRRRPWLWSTLRPPRTRMGDDSIPRWYMSPTPTVQESRKGVGGSITRRILYRHSVISPAGS